MQIEKSGNTCHLKISSKFWLEDCVVVLVVRWSWYTTYWLQRLELQALMMKVHLLYSCTQYHPGQMGLSLLQFHCSLKECRDLTAHAVAASPAAEAVGQAAVLAAGAAVQAAPIAAPYVAAAAEGLPQELCLTQPQLQLYATKLMEEQERRKKHSTVHITCIHNEQKEEFTFEFDARKVYCYV